MASGLAAVAVLSLGLAACTSGTAEPQPPPTDAPTATPTVAVGFAVAVTAVPTRPPRRVRARPAPTRFVAPRGQYMVLLPNSGPPVSKTITVRAGRLRPRVQVELVWRAGARGSPLVTSSWTDGSGGLSAPFVVPAAYPGRYTISIRMGDTVYGTAVYRVVSRASLTSAVSPGSAGDVVTVAGRRFVPGLKLLLAAYPMFRGPKPVALGYVTCSPTGTFKFQTSTRKLVPGEYMLQAWSMGNIAAQMATTYFQVVV